MEVNIHQAKTHLSRLLQRVAGGEEITIARAGKAIARLVPLAPEKRTVRPLGMDRGAIWIAEDFDAPLPDDFRKAFYGGKPPELETPRARRVKRKSRR